MSAQLRQQEHLKGREFMEQGAYLQALEVFHKTLADYGPHVGLISDITAVYYLMGRIEDWHIMALRLEKELGAAQGILSEMSLIKTQIFLGKMFEEQAEVQKALDIYAAAEKSAGQHSAHRLKAQTQRLRLMSFLGIRTGLAELYRLVSTARAESEHFEIEFEHSLMLAEMVLFGMESAGSRLVSVFTKPDIDSSDLRLLYIDFAEESLRQSSSLQILERLASRVPLADCDEFEKIINLMITSPEFVLSPQDLNKLSTQLPLLGLLRVMTLQMKRSNSEESSGEVQRRLLFLLDSLSAESKNHLVKKWQADLGGASKILYFSKGEKILFIKGQQLQIKADSFAMKVLELMVESKTQDIESFVQHVFEAEYNISYYDRTRIALQHLNKELAILTGHPKSIGLTKKTVELAAALRIQKT
jgi:tetratricopeptide (TPR) repeat protein